MRRQDREFSKRLVKWMLIIMTASMVFTYVSIYLKDSVNAVDIFNTVATLSGSVFMGYFGKSGVQNYTKIKTRKIDQEQQEDDEE